MGYRDISHAIKTANRGQGSLVASLITHDPETAHAVAWVQPPITGDSTSTTERPCRNPPATAPLSRTWSTAALAARGAEKSWAASAVSCTTCNAQRSRAAPTCSAPSARRWVPGRHRSHGPGAPLYPHFDELHIGDTTATEPRTVTLDDIETSPISPAIRSTRTWTKRPPSEPVLPGPRGPWLSVAQFRGWPVCGAKRRPGSGQYGPGWPALSQACSGRRRHQGRADRQATKHPEMPQYGEVRWQVHLTNQNDEPVAEYELLTMNAFAPA